MISWLFCLAWGVDACTLYNYIFMDFEINHYWWFCSCCCANLFPSVGWQTVLCWWCYVRADPGRCGMPEGHSCSSGRSRSPCGALCPSPYEDWQREAAPRVRMSGCPDGDGWTNQSPANHRCLPRGESGSARCLKETRKSQESYLDIELNWMWSFTMMLPMAYL